VPLVPLGLLVLGAALAYGVAVRRSKVTDLAVLPAWLVVAPLAGFGREMLVLIALTGEGRGFGAYYLHFMVAPLGFALGLAVAECWRRRSTRALAIAVLLYVIGFGIVISWAQTLLFAGLLGKSSLRFYTVPDALPPLLGVPEALRRLDALAFPAIGAVAWLVGGGLALAGLIAASKAAATLRRGRA
jgi:hypothetical protein